MWERQGVRTVGSVKRAEHFRVTQKTCQVSSQVVVKGESSSTYKLCPLYKIHETENLRAVISSCLFSGNNPRNAP